MPRKGMRGLFFSPGPSFSSQSPARFGFSVSVMERTLEWAEPIILKWDTNTAAVDAVTSPFRREIREFIKAIDGLQGAMHLMSDENTIASEEMNRAQNLMKIAMKRMQKAFYQILSMNRAPLDPESISNRSSLTSTASNFSDFEDNGIRRDGSESISDVEHASCLVMADLRSIAECMISVGYTKECVSTYKLIRKSIVDEGIYKLGVEKFTSGQMKKMDWSALDLKIHNWIKAARIAVKTLFNRERILCDYVFANSDSIRESCFADVTRDGAMILFGFPETVARNTKKAALKAFRALDMYATISTYLLPEIDSIFPFESTMHVKSQAITSLIKLGEFALAAIDDFESVIKKHPSRKAVVPGAGIHDLTVDAMEYLSNLSDYSDILSHILADSSPPSTKVLPESYFHFSDSGDSPAPPLSHKLAWLVLVLLCQLDSNSQSYRDASQSYLFLANNIQYAVVRVRSSNLRYLLGEEWVTNHEAKIKRFASYYERLGWGPVIDSIQHDPAAVEEDPEKVRRMFQKFNSSFDQACKKQAACVVPDNRLRDDFKVSIAKRIVLLYHQFYISHRKVLERGRYSASVVRYAPRDVENKMVDLFKC